MAKKTPGRRTRGTKKGESAAAKRRTSKEVDASEKATSRTQPQAVSANCNQQPSFAVVGLGASAGGLDAFKQFFTAMPADSGLAFVLIQHLDPTHESLTAELLDKQTEMSVVQIVNKMRVEPNHVYVIPPNKSLAISGAKLHLTDPLERRGLRLPIDFFFRSLADDQQERAIGIVLSGTGTDGTQGVREIKAAGGMVMAQQPETAQHDGMPRSAIAAGIVDYVLPIEQMPDRLVNYVRHGYVNGDDLAASGDKAPDEMQAIVNLLRARLKYDFSCYKKGTLTRRVQRRMGINHIEKMSDYVEFLRTDQDEVTALYKDLLINVTNFFRDAESWSELEQQVITPLVREHEADLPIRVWTPGCATGEEPYSLAMLLLEHSQAADKACRIQIFASDIDQDALALARAGIYPESIAANVSAERLRRFFVKGDHTYCINKEIRESVVFAEQHLISDPPFSKLDLITCRNLLIYLEPEIQKKIFALFHYALRQGGYLFLGNSETINLPSDLFEGVSRKWRIYRRIGRTRHDKLELPTKPAKTARFPTQVLTELTETRIRRIAGLAQHLMLQRFAPACVLINPKAEVLYLNGAVDEFLQLPRGELATDLYALAREGLRTKLRAAVHQAIQDDQPVIVDGVRIKRDGKYVTIRIIVEPLQQPKEAEGLLLVRFEGEGGSAALSEVPQPEATARKLTKSEGGSESDYEPIIRQLEDELRVSREDLRSSIEELETSNEEFKAASEEVTSVNEELLSTNEELETSKEELQSLNEELQTVNSQLEQKVAELESSNNDLANLLSSTDIATLFLDRQFRIKRFTPATARVMRVIDSDRGRLLSDLVMNITDDDLLADAETVLQRLTPIEKEVDDHAKNYYLRRIVPYRMDDNRIDGVVITFVDITQKNLDAQAVRDSEARYRELVESSPNGIVIQQDSRIVYASPTLVRMFGYASSDDLIGRTNLETLAAPEERAALRVRIVACSRGERVPPHLGWRGLRQDGSEIWIASNAATFPWQGRPAVIEFLIDVTEMRHSTEVLELAQLRQRSVVDAAIDAVIQMDQLGRITDFNTSAERIFGHTRADVMGKPLAELIIPPRLRDSHYRGLAHYLATGEGPVVGKSLEMSALRSDGSEFPVELSVTSILGADPPAFTGFLRDITERKRAEAELQLVNEQLEERVNQRTQELESANAALRDSKLQFQSAFGAIMEGSSAAIVMLAMDKTITHWNRGAERMFGYQATETVGKNIRMLLPPDHSQDYEEITARLTANEIVEEYETTRRHKDGSRIDVALTASLLKNESGQPIGISVIKHDIRERKRLEQHMAALVDAERQRLGRELHDTVGQECTAISMLVTTLQHQPSSPSMQAEILSRLEQSAEAAKRQLRSVAKGLFPVDVDADGLRVALEDLAEATGDAHGLDCNFECPAPIRLQSNFVATQLFLIAREAVHNAVKHAHAKEIVIHLDDAEGVRLSVRDDGVGMTPNSSVATGMGVRTMRYRCDLIGGEYQLKSDAAGGTSVTVFLRGGQKNNE